MTPISHREGLLLVAFSLACRDASGPTIREASLSDEGVPIDLPSPEATPPDDPELPEDTGDALDTGSPVDTSDEVIQPPDPFALCFLGSDLTRTTCVPTVAASGLGPDYQWPSSSDARYRTPRRVLDLAAVDLSIRVAPNFRASEFVQEWKGRFGLLQPHAVERLQAVRDAVGGPVQVTSGFRSPAYNAGVGGATFSRHMYGDAADIYASSLSVGALGALCEAQGAGYVGYYSGHVHCDWRNDALDSVLFGHPFHHHAPLVDDTPEHSATLKRSGLRFEAPGEGWDEGEPLREWAAWDAAGRRIATHTGDTFDAPPTTARVEVVVGRAVTLEWPSPSHP